LAGKGIVAGGGVVKLHLSLLFPHQLYVQHPAVAQGREVLLIEEPLFFADDHYPAKFHKMKLVMHRASMKRYAAETLHDHKTRYINHAEANTRTLLQRLAAEGVTHLHIVDPTDYMLEKRLRREATRHALDIVWYESPNFINTPSEIEGYFRGKKTYHQTDFYIWQRKKHGILLDKDAPLGGRWTYDTENRQKLKPNVALPPEPILYNNAYIREARAYVEQHFGDHPGKCDDFIYPTTHTEAEDLLHQFLHQKLGNFGAYQDAITTRTPFVFHSLISSSLNSGLLAPMQVVTRTLEFFEQHPATPLASVEGFVRQVLGWREFMRVIYLREGVKERTSNFWKHNRAVDERWYNGTLGIPPVDDAIRKVNQYAYAHHIERLMLLGNFMALNQIHPDEVYRWFMEMFIDAYDWVMVPNVYGMSQYADGGLITTKPYLSSSNYVRKMSDYKMGEWCEVWDSLYWHFIHQHEAFFRANPRLSMMTGHLDRMGEDKLREHHERARGWLAV
jgi:deoxyribodipyrimidine photolyase-related protein